MQFCSAHMKKVFHIACQFAHYITLFLKNFEATFGLFPFPYICIKCIYHICPKKISLKKVCVIVNMESSHTMLIYIFHCV